MNHLQQSDARLGNCNGERDKGKDVEQVERAGGEVGQVQAEEGLVSLIFVFVGHCQEDRNPFTSSLSLELSATHVCVKYQKQHSQRMFPLGKWRHQQLLV